MEELVKQVERVADELEQLNTTIDALNKGEMWGGTLVDALNEIAKAVAGDKHWSNKK